MIIVDTVDRLQTILVKARSTRKIHFIPTMGALHKGHVSLIQKAKQNNGFIIVSLFINPTQFNEPRDYHSYPKTLTADKNLLKKLDIDCLFIPTERTIYPNNNDFSIQVHCNIGTILEGAARPGHFAGVLTVVMKFLLLIQPTYAYFGEKDYQQAILVEKMIKSFFLKTIIVKCPIIRETSGLPFSSRNSNLTVAEKSILKDIYQILRNDSFNCLDLLVNKIKEKGASVEYLKEINGRIFLAMQLGKTRLIDNFLKETGPC